MNAILTIIPKLPPVQQLSSGIIRILGQNPGSLTLQGTNSYLLGTGFSKSRVLIDTSDFINGDYVRNITEVLTSLDKKAFISDIILTHWHADNVGAVNQLRDELKSLSGVSANILKYPSNEHHNTINFKYDNLGNNQLINVSGLGQLRVLHTPGHTDDHICLFLGEQNVLFTGDLIMGFGSTSFEYLNSYMKSLNSVNEIMDKVKIMFPGHGQVIRDPGAKITEYISYRKKRISEVYSFLDTLKWVTERELFNFIYQDVAQQLISRCLMNQKQALIYLEKNKLIESTPLTEIGDFELTYGLKRKWRRMANSPNSFSIEFS